jgi:hypothetical protein
VAVRGTQVKIRSPWGVFFLTLITLGIYYVVWYYKINRELRDAANIDVSPGIATIAITFGALIIIPPFVSFYRTFRRIRTAQDAAGVPDPAMPWLGFALVLIAYVFLPFEVVYAQSNLNRLWRQLASSV